MTTNIVSSFAGHSLQSSDYAAHLLGNDVPMLRIASPVLLRPVRRMPMIAGVDHQELILRVVVNIKTTDYNARQAELSQWFAIGSSGVLAVTFDGDSRVVEGYVTALRRFDGGPALFAAVITCADPRWRSATAHSDSQSASASPKAWTLTPAAAGAAEDEPTFILKPTSAKGAAYGYTNRAHVIVANRANRAFPSYPVELSGSASPGFDTATEVAASRMQADGDDLRVRVDGVEVPRWFSTNTSWDINDDTTRIWSVLSLSPMRSAVLFANITDVSPALGGELEVVKGGTVGWNPRGDAFVIDDECFLYTGLTESNANGRAAFTGITRAARNTTAASHTAGTPGTPNVFWVEHDIEIVWGYSTVAAPDAHDEEKPLLDFTAATLTNRLHLQNATSGFAHTTQPRALPWVRTLASRGYRDSLIVEPSGTPATAMAAAYYAAGAQAGKPNTNQWGRSFPAPIAASSNALAYTRTQAAGIGLLVYGTDVDGNEVLLNTHIGVASGASVNVTPAAALYALTFFAFDAVIFKRPAGNSAGSQALSGTATANGQRFYTGSEPVHLSQVLATVQDDGSSRTVSTSIYSDDGATTPAPSAAIATASQVTTGAGVAESLVFTFDIILPANSYFWFVASCATGTVTLKYWADALHANLKGESDWTRLAGTSAHANNIDITMIGYKAPTATECAYMDSNGPTDADQVSVSVTTLVLDSSGAPYVALMPREDAYHLNGVLANTTTGQTATLDLICALQDEVEIEVGDRAVRNRISGARIDHAVEFSDEDEWIGLDAGANAMTWTEAGVAGLAITSTFYDRYD